LWTDRTRIAIINTVSGAQAQRLVFDKTNPSVQCRYDNHGGATAAVNAIEMLKKKRMNIKSIQEYHGIKPKK
jgi:hypothetical protein